MMSSAPLDAYKLALPSVATGILSHWGYFIHGEHHKDGVRLLMLAFLSTSAFFCLFLLLTDAGLIRATFLTFVVSASYLLSLSTSIIVYRVFLHPLRHFPGPFLLTVSKLRHMYLVASTLDNFQYLERWRVEYGTFVRTGPSEITIYHPDAVPLLLGSGSKCTKAAWYDMAASPYSSLQSERIKAIHDKERRIWDRGFSTKALLSYEGRILNITKDLIDQISKHTGEVIDLSKWVGHYSLDIMSDFAFGRNLNIVKSGEDNGTGAILHGGMKMLGIFGSIPWLFIMLVRIPSGDFDRFISWSEGLMEQREKMEIDVPDVMSHLIDASEGNADYKKRTALLSSESRLLMTAGSDTTAAAINCAFYYLATNPEHARILRAELKSLTSPDSERVLQDVKNGDHLNGVINEALRLHPPIPGGVFRLTPPEGITVAGTYIPGNITVVAPPYSIQRLESCFMRPDEFIPERWYSKPELITNKDAFAPFSIGPYSCVGKQVALMELRAVLAEVMSRFDVCLAPGENGAGLVDNPEDCFTISVRGNLNVIFTPISSDST